MNTIPEQFKIDASPLADPQAVVTAPHARFTLLTSRLVRMEYSPGSNFEDQASQVFWYRQQPVPGFQVKKSAETLEIVTDHLHLYYRSDLGFSPQGLWIELPGAERTWRFGDVDFENMKGTTRTLDQTAGAIELEPGLISRQGWGLVDDTSGLVFNPHGWLENRPSEPGYQDLYFFGYGYAYAQCLVDFYKISGPAPLIPRWSLGNWWSRYWKYSQDELAKLVLDFRAHHLPLSVCIIDMDWHITETGNQCSGWTGYTWNDQLFPNPPGFLQFLHTQGLRTSLNLHPAEGIHAHEAAYPQMAHALGIDSASKQPVEFDPTHPRFVQAYFKFLHHPLERDGVDFWWMDWQQGNPTRLPGLNLLWWINHLHAYDHGRDRRRRSFIFSRWGGLGNHRYPIGFSGDTHVTWEALAYQPYFTATAANVGYGWWSHDIGGHFGGIEDPELFTRWVQFGVFSPILRLHSTQNPYHERRPFAYDEQTLAVTRHAMQLRHAFIPYLYSMAWRDHRESIPLLRPMYHVWPENDQAYACPAQYLFGSELVVAPFTSPQDPDTRLSRSVVWLPEGDWFDLFNANVFQGNGWHAIYGGLRDIPVFARAGAIVPMGPLTGWGGINLPEAMTVHVFPGADNHFELYEDDGVSTDYLRGASAITPLTLNWGGDHLKFEVGSVHGETGLVPAARAYTLIFHALHLPEHIRVLMDGQPYQPTWDYDAEKNTLTLSEIHLSPANHLVVALQASGSLQFRRDQTLDALYKLVSRFRMNTDGKKLLADQLSEILNDPGNLARFLLVLAPSHLRALLETLTGCGIERSTCTGEEIWVLWNNRDDKHFRYLISSEQPHVWLARDRFFLEKGVAPSFKVVRTAKEAGNPLILQVSYSDLYKFSLAANLHKTESPSKEK